MNSWSMRRRISSLVSCLLLTILTGSVAAQSSDANLNRYFELLERQPKYGTVFDKIYAAHAESGSLEALVDRYRQRITADENGGRAALIVGLVELQRGHDTQAIEALRQAEQLRTNDPMPPIVLSRALQFIGDLDGARAAFERALTRQPNRLDVLDGGLLLGQSLQRHGLKSAAEHVWQQIDALFPNDVRVQEQLASAIARSGEHALAAARFEQLARNATEANDRVAFKTRALEERVLNGTKLAEVLPQFEALQRGLKPDSWQAKQLHQRLEQLFLRTDDLAGLTDFYQQQVVRIPDDVELRQRFAQLLVRRGMLPQAIKTLQDATGHHPKSTTLLRALIPLVVKSQQHSAAERLYARLDELEPHQSATVRGWGEVILSNESRPLAERRTAALDVWKRLYAQKPDDPVTLLQTADLLQRHEFMNDALKLYERTVQLAPNEVHYREELGQLLLRLNRRNDALATWRAMISGERNLRENHLRLAAVLHRADEHEAAWQVLHAACQPEFLAAQKNAGQKNQEIKLDELLQLADYARAVRRDADVDAALSRAKAQATNLDEAQRVQQAEVDWLIERGQLNVALDQQRDRCRQLASVPNVQRFVSLCRAARRWPDAAWAVDDGLKLNPDSAALWREQTLIALNTDNWLKVLVAHERLLSLEPARRAEHLKQIARTRSRLGQVDAALRAASELLEIAPNHRDSLDFYVDLHWQHGRHDDALKVLRRVVRAAPNDVGALLKLAGSLASLERFVEATEVAWQAFDVATEPREQIRIAERLAVWHHQSGRWTACVERLERQQRVPATEYAATLSLAAAYRSISDYRAARQQLASLSATRPNDLELLRELVRDAEHHHEWNEASDFQRRIVDAQPTREERIKLILLLERSGDDADALKHSRDLANDTRSLPDFLTLIDEFMGRAHFNIAARLLYDRAQNVKHWEIEFRLGVAFARTGRHLGANQRLQWILDQKLAIDSLSCLADSSTSSESTDLRDWQRHQAASAAYWDPSHSDAPANVRPRDYGEARIGAIVTMIVLQQHSAAYDFLHDFMARLPRPKPLVNWHKNGPKIDSDQPLGLTTAAELWQWFHVLTAIQSDKSSRSLTRLVWRIAERLAGEGNLFGKWALISSMRGQSTNHPELREEYERLRSLLHECQAAVNRGSYEWMKSNADELTATADEQQAITVTEWLQLLPAVRPQSAFDRFAPQWIATAGSNNDITTLRGLLEHELRRLEVVVNGNGSRSTRSGGKQRPQNGFENWRPSDDSFAELSASDSPRLLMTDADLKVFAYALQAKADRELLKSMAQRLQVPFELESPTLNDLRTVVRAVLLWRAKDRKAALEALQQAVAAHPNNYPLRHEWVLLLTADDRVREAITVLQQAPANDAPTLFHRDRTLIELGSRVRDQATVQAAAQRLAQLTAAPTVELEILSVLITLNTDDLALSKAQDLRRRYGNDLHVLDTLITIYERLQRPQDAVSMAHDLLLRVPEYPIKSQGTYTLQSTNHVPHALAMLSKADPAQLKTLATNLEAEARNHPRATRPREVLKAYREFLGQTGSEFVSRSEVAQANNLNPAQLLARAKTLSEEGQTATACELSLLALRREPSLLKSHFAVIRNRFDNAHRMPELLALITQSKVVTLQNGIETEFDIAVINLAFAALKDSESSEAASQLLMQIWPTIPLKRLSEVGLCREPHLWKGPSAFTQWAQQTVIPETATWGAIASQKPVTDDTKSSTLNADLRWLGIIGSSSVDDVGKGSCALTRQLDTYARLGTLREPTYAALTRFPQWRTGEVILALLEGDEGRGESFERRLTVIAQESDPPLEVQFVIAQEAAKRHSVERMAMRVIQLLVRRPHRELRDLNRDPAIVLSQIYRRAGLHSEGSDLLRDWMQRQNQVRGDVFKAASAEQLRTIRNLTLVAYEETLRHADNSALTSYLHALRIHRAYVGNAPTPEQLEQGSMLFHQLKHAISQSPREVATEFFATQLAPASDAALRLASNSLTTLVMTDPDEPPSIRSWPDLVSDRSHQLVTQWRAQNPPSPTMSERTVLIILQAMSLASGTSPTNIELQQSFEQLVHATESASDADILQSSPVLAFGLRHPTARIRQASAIMAERISAAASRTSRVWQSAILKLQLDAAHDWGDIHQEDTLKQRLKTTSIASPKQP